MKICCVVEGFDGQATERCLGRLVAISRARRSAHEWTFICTMPKEGRDEAGIRALGCRVERAPIALSDTLRFLVWLRRIFRDGQFDVLHFHHDLLSGLYLLAAMGIRLQKRIVHVHNTSLALPTPNHVKAKVGAAFLRSVCLGLADNVVGVSGAALGSILRGRQVRTGRDLTIPFGADTSAIATLSRGDRELLRKGLGIAPSTLTLLFAGRLVDSKNPAFCLKILEELVHRGMDVALVFAGTGPGLAALAREAESRDLLSHVKFLGWREDLVAVMNAADVLLWTAVESIVEGLGLVVVEAQACGLPIVASRSLPEEAIVVPERVQWCGLTEGSGNWADAVARASSARRPSIQESVAVVDASGLSMEACASALFRLYDGTSDLPRLNR